MPTVLHAAPFPCAVYVRPPCPAASVAGDPAYRFSHCCEASVVKPLPCSLRVRDLQDYRHACVTTAAAGGYQPAMRRACFLVLVSGDVAQCITVANASERRTHFLFRGSRFSKAMPPTATSYASEFHADYIPVRLFSTLAMFARGRLTAVADIECGLVLLPAALREREVPSIAKWMDHLIAKAARNSTWTNAEPLFAYDETTLALRHGTRVDRKQGEQDGSDRKQQGQDASDRKRRAQDGSDRKQQGQDASDRKRRAQDGSDRKRRAQEDTGVDESDRRTRTRTVRAAS